MLKPLLAVAVVCIGLTSCGTTGVTEPEETPSPSASNTVVGRPEFSLANFEICYPLSKMDDLDSTLARVEEGLLSKQDLEEGLSSLSFASEFATMLLKGSDYYEKYPETEQILPKAELPAFTERTKAEGIWYARTRVKLIDYKIINIAELKNKMASYRSYLQKYCADYKK